MKNNIYFNQHKLHVGAAQQQQQTVHILSPSHKRCDVF